MDASEKISIRAKINLSLNVTGISGGFHMLDTVVASVGLADVISVCLGQTTRVEFTDKSIDAENSNAYKAAAYMTQKYDLPPVDIKIVNNIPCGTGLGGSSAGCAGVIEALSRKFLPKITLDEKRAIANMFGSDTAYMLSGGYARLTGRGECISPFSSSVRKDVMIAFKGRVGTKNCFSLFDKEGQSATAADNDALVNALACGKECDAFAQMKNALAAPAMKLNPHIGEICRLASEYPHVMTGSGAGVVIFSDDDSLEEKLKNAAINVIRTELQP